MESSEKSESGRRGPREARADRLAKALRANIGRRKAQARSRDAQTASESAPRRDRSTDPAPGKDEP